MVEMLHPSHGIRHNVALVECYKQVDVPISGFWGCQNSRSQVGADSRWSTPWCLIEQDSNRSRLGKRTWLLKTIGVIAGILSFELPKPKLYGRLLL